MWCSCLDRAADHISKMILASKVNKNGVLKKLWKGGYRKYGFSFQITETKTLFV
jgi:hypothetical protein